MNASNIKVSVCITAYNVGKYIAQSIDSVLAQETNFDFEILIGEDCSTDNTLAIIESYKQKNLKNIRFFYNDKNLGYSANFINLINNSQGEYIAQIDADDIILSKQKLQLLVEFLDSKPDYSICIHNFQIIDDFGNIINPDALGADYKNIEKDHFLYHTQAGGMAMWRRSALPKPLPVWLKEVGNPVDHALFLLASARYLVGYVPLILMAYRKHPTSITTLAKKEYLLKKDIFMNQHVREYYADIDKSHDDIFRWGVSYYGYRLSYVYLSQGKIFQFIYYFTRAFINWPTLSIKKHKDFFYMSSPEAFNRIKSIFGRT